MCRHLGYLGPPVSLASLVLEPEHSLYRQSWAPRDMRGGGSVNADGFGLGWYRDGQPVRYRRGVPIWADENLPGLARAITSTAVLAAVRNGTPGMALGEPAVAPFRSGRWFFSHNGLITGWPDSIRKLAETLPVTDLLTLDAPTDSALLWALIRLRSAEPAGSELTTLAPRSAVDQSQAAAPPSAVDRPMTAAPLSAGDQPMVAAPLPAGGQSRAALSPAGGQAPASSSGMAEAVRAVVSEVADAAPGSRLNVLLTDGRQLIGTSWTHSLWIRQTTDSVSLASEPAGPADWEPVPEYSLVVADAAGVRITQLDPPSRRA